MFYVARYITASLEGSPIFQPSGTDTLETSWWSIDLRPPGSETGFALLRTEESLAASPNRLLLTDDPDDVSPLIAQRLSNRLGFNIDPETSFRKLVMALLLKYGDDKNPARWNQLKPLGGRLYEVWLGERLWTVPVVQGGAVVTDNFNRADSTNLGANWTEVNGDMEIVGNLIRPVSTSAEAFIRNENAVATNDNYAQVTAYRNSTLGTTSTGVLVRLTGGVGYMGTYAHDSGAERIYARSSGGSYTNLTSMTGATTPINTVRTLRLEVSGSSLKTFLDGVQQLAVTDTTTTTGKLSGVRLFKDTAGSYTNVDNFETGDLGGPLNFPVAVSATSISVPTLKKGIASQKLIVSTSTPSMSKGVGIQKVVVSSSTPVVIKGVGIQKLIASTSTPSVSKDVGVHKAVVSSSIPSVVKNIGILRLFAGQSTSLLLKVVAKGIQVVTASAASLHKGVAKEEATVSTSVVEVDRSSGFNILIEIVSDSGVNLLKGIGKRVNIVSGSSTSLTKQMSRQINVGSQSAVSLFKRIAIEVRSLTESIVSVAFFKGGAAPSLIAPLRTKAVDIGVSKVIVLEDGFSDTKMIDGGTTSTSEVV